MQTGINADTLVAKALQQARHGQKDAARRTLAQALKLDPVHPRAWYLLSLLLDDPQKIIQCLERVLKTQPNNRAAKKRLAELNNRQPVPLQTQPAIAAKPQPAQKKKNKFLPLFLTLILVGLFSFVAGGIFLWRQTPAIQVFAANLGTSTRVINSTQASHSAVLAAGSSSTPFQPLLPTEMPLPTLTFTPAPTYTPTPTATATITLTSTETAQPTPTPTVSPTIYPLLPPAQAHITDITGDIQKMPLSCEASAATDWAAYFGHKINEYEFQDRLPVSDNPDKGFVGSVFGAWGQIPPAPYGVHAEPVAKLLQQYGLNAHAVHAFSLNGIKKEVAAGRPVIVWVTGLVEPGSSVPYLDSEGDRTLVAPYQHAVIVIGYNPSSVTILDGGKFYQRSNPVFMQSWQSLGFQAIIMKNE